MKQELSEMIHYFGYAKHDDDSSNLFAFFDYEGKADPAHVAMYKGYLKQNERSQKLVMQQDCDSEVL